MAAAVLLEIVVGHLRGRQSYEPKDTAASLSFLTLNTIVMSAIAGISLAFYTWTYQYQLYDIENKLLSWRGMLTPAKRGKGVKRIANTETRSPAERLSAMTWAQQLKRVFNIAIEVCGRCGGAVRIIAYIEDQDVMPDKAGQALDRILAHLESKEQNTPTLPHLAPPARAHPGLGPFSLARIPAEQFYTSGTAASSRTAAA